MDDGSGGPELTGLRRHTWWAVPGTTACLLVLFAAAWISDGDLPAWARALAVAALVAEAASAVVLLSRRLAPPPAAPTGWLVTGAAAAVVLAAIPLARREYGPWAVAPAIMVAIWASFLPPRRRRLLITIATPLAALPGVAVGLLSGDDDLTYAALFPPGLLVFTLWMTLGPLWAWDTARRLDEARGLAAELAVKEERLRFAADLHDIQGHHLQVIALKSELAARLADVDPARAATQMREVRELSADALRDTRAVVQGYRRTTLDEEIANATRVLAAAGIDARMTVEAAAVDLAPTARHLLGLVMREATTNVLRHSRARHAEVDHRRTGTLVRLRIGNDGAGPRPDATSGTGLRALADRLRTAGGELTWDHDGDRFTVTARLPATEEAP